MEERVAIGVDIGGTNTKIGLVRAITSEPGWQFLNYKVIPSNLKTPDPVPFMETLYQATDELASQLPIAGIGISLCSLINHEHTGASISVNAPALNGLNIKQLFTTRFGCPVSVINDVNAYAVAEYHFGAGRGVNRLLCLGLGTGLAIAAILEGKVLETWAGVVADAGRIVLDPEADACCAGGVRGSAEALIGTSAIERLGYQKFGRAISAREIIAASFRGEPIACEVMAELGTHTGHLLAVLSPIFFPRRIVITGGTAEAGEPLFQAIKTRYEELIGNYMQGLAYLETGQAEPVEIVKGELGPEASILGSVYEYICLDNRNGILDLVT